MQSADLPFNRETIDQTVNERFQKVALHFPNSVALTGNGKQWTYRELDQETNRIAHAILAVIKPGNGCVAILTEQTPEMVFLVLGVIKAGKTYLGIHPQSPKASMQEMVEDTQAELILTSNQLFDQAQQIKSTHSAILKFGDISLDLPSSAPEIKVQASDPLAIFYTSGTTGKSKGVIKSNRMMLHRVYLATQHDKVVPQDRQSLLTHCAFSSSEADIFCTLLLGATVCIFNIMEEGSDGFQEWIYKEQITLLHPPVLFFRILLEGLEGRELFPTVRLIALAGDTVLTNDLKEWRAHFSKSCVLLHRYSTTETSLLTVAQFDHTSNLDMDAVSAGHPVVDKSLLFLDETGKPVPTGEQGELAIQSRYLSDGYWGLPEETASVFSSSFKDPQATLYHTGDYGRQLPDGTLQFLSRREHLAKIRGFRVDTREVEQALYKLAEVSKAVVLVSRSDEQDQLYAFLEMAVEQTFDSKQIKGKLLESLPEWKIPKRMETIQEFPKTLNGKIDRQTLAQSLEKEPSALEKDSKPNEPQVGSLEAELMTIWKDSITINEVTLDDNFLDLGANSIAVMMMRNRIKEQFGIPVSNTQFFSHPTIRQLSAFLRNTLGEDEEVKSNLVSSEISTKNSEVNWTVAEAFIEQLNKQGVRYIFINPGTDTAPILEVIAQYNTEKKRAPEVVLCLHESVALAAAQGYFMLTGKPQVVMVHVDVGTLNLGANLHNAQRGRSGVVICAGRSPYTVDGSVEGHRNKYTQWIQEQSHQAGIVQGYVKWSYELSSATNLSLAVDRAFQMAGSDPAGPVYLTLPREVLMQKIDATLSIPSARTPALAPRGPEQTSLLEAAQWLLRAKKPLILTSYAGRNPEAVPALVNLAEALGASVVENRQRLNFPSDHPLHAGFTPGRHLANADCILIIDHDVPWIPSHTQPSDKSRIIHVDTDPLKSDIPIWGFSVDLSIHADAELFCKALTVEIQKQQSLEDQQSANERLQMAELQQRSKQESDTVLRNRLSQSHPIAPEWAAMCLNKILNPNTVVIGEVVSNAPALWQFLKLNTPGSYFQSLGSGLGWGLGAAVGAKLADPSKTIVCVVGDGAWLFASPLTAYWAALQNKAPFLTVVFNNQEYFSTTESILTLAPEGFAQQSGNYPACDLPKPPLFAKVAQALGLWAKTVEDPIELTSVLMEAQTKVEEGTPALVDICISSSRPES